jgi:transcriptional regulator GlxA family with amidase domain
MNGDQLDELEGYSLFYRLLRDLLPRMAQSDITYDKALQTAIEYITANWKESFSVATLAKKCCVSESTLYHLFQNELGQSPVRFLNSIRINVALEYLENSNYSIATISQLVGFNSENHFRKVFSEFTGTTPLKFKKRR